MAHIARHLALIPYETRRPTEQQWSDALVCTRWQNGPYDIYWGQIYTIPHPLHAMDQCIGRVHEIRLYQSIATQNQPVAIVELSLVFSGFDIHNKDIQLVPEDYRDIYLELVTGTNQLIDTDRTRRLWYWDLEELVNVLEFHPSAIDMKIHPAVHFWMRQDVTLGVEETLQGKRLYSVNYHADFMCNPDDCTRDPNGHWHFERGYLRCCVQCRRGQGQWYHLDCLGQGHDLMGILHEFDPEGMFIDDSTPDWLRMTSDMWGNDDRDCLWQRIRSMPIQRGYTTDIERPTLSFERLLLEVFACSVHGGPLRGPPAYGTPRYLRSCAVCTEGLSEGRPHTARHVTCVRMQCARRASQRAARIRHAMLPVFAVQCARRASQRAACIRHAMLPVFVCSVHGGPLRGPPAYGTPCYLCSCAVCTEGLSEGRLHTARHVTCVRMQCARRASQRAARIRHAMLPVFVCSVHGGPLRGPPAYGTPCYLRSRAVCTEGLSEGRLHTARHVTCVRMQCARRASQRAARIRHTWSLARTVQGLFQISKYASNSACLVGYTLCTVLHPWN
ncbi:hypothetical protein C8T65DRAFT_703812 [Cerioporus squamosus]|nr:hypothetical protein C8T65DRAFT_703812 [Cerioporus squamosus]